MTSDPHDPIQSAPGVDPEDRLEEDYSPSSERETEQLQDDQEDSPALADPDIDRDSVKLLPGTGDYTDDGDVELKEGQVRMPHLEPGRTDDRPPA